MPKMNPLIIAVIVLVCLTGDSLGGAWTQKKGHGYYKLGFRLVRADQFYQPNGIKIDIPTLSDYMTSFYGEYGLHDRVTLVASIPFFRRITLNRLETSGGTVLAPGDATTGISDSDIGVRVGLWQTGGTVFSTEILFALPIGDDEQESGLFTGDGEFNQQLKLQVGHSFYPAPFYVSGEIGFNNRSKGYSDEILYSVELGYRFLSRWLVQILVRGLESLENSDSAVSGTGGLFGNNQRYLAYGPQISYFFSDHLGVSAGIETATRTRNVLSAPAFYFGIFLAL